LTGTRAAIGFSYFAASASRSSKQSTGGWNDPDLKVLKKEEKKDGLGQGDIICLVLFNLFIKNRRFLGKRVKRIWMIF